MYVPVEEFCQNLEKFRYTSKLHFYGDDFHKTKKRIRKKIKANCQKVMDNCEPTKLHVTSIPIEFVRPAFTKLKNLTELYLYSTHNPLYLDDTFFLSICDDLSQLVVLTMYYSTVSEKGLVNLPKLTSLKELTLHTFSNYCKVRDVGLSIISNLLPLTKLELYGTTSITDHGWAYFNQLHFLKELYLSSSVMNDTGLSVISATKTLEVLDISD